MKPSYLQILRLGVFLSPSIVVWHNSLTQENSDNLERVQKSAIRIILGQSFDDCEEALEKVELDSLKQHSVEVDGLQMNGAI